MTGTIHVYTGEGGGKTTAALGVALRAIGWNKKVVMVQFMKGRPTGEIKAAKKLGKDFTIRQFGRKDFVDLENPTKKDKALAEQGLRFASLCLKKDPDMIILDEINLASGIGLISSAKVIDFLSRTKKGTAIYLTGRNAPEEFLKIADLITSVETIKEPKKMLYRKGIEY